MAFLLLLSEAAVDWLLEIMIVLIFLIPWLVYLDRKERKRIREQKEYLERTKGDPLGTSISDAIYHKYIAGPNWMFVEEYNQKHAPTTERDVPAIQSSELALAEPRAEGTRMRARLCSRCSHCLEDGSKFCANCRTTIPHDISCRRCDHRLASDFKFCPNCGTDVSQLLRPNASRIETTAHPDIQALVKRWIDSHEEEESYTREDVMRVEIILGKLLARQRLNDSEFEELDGIVIKVATLGNVFRDAHVRALPTRDAESLGMLRDGDKLLILQRKGDWFQVIPSIPGGVRKAGWIYARFVKAVP